MTIRKRRDRDGWLVQVELDGERRRKQVSTKWEAERVERTLQRSLRDGRPHYSVSEALLAYVMGLRVRGKATTLKSGDYHGRALERHLGSHFNLAELNQSVLDGLVGKLRAEKWRDTSINGALRVLRAASNLAAREGHLAKPPRIPMLRELRRLPTILSAEQVEVLVAKASPDAGLAILLAAHAGLRHQEILHLTAGDVSGGEIRVTAKHGWSPKAHAERTVPVNGRLAPVLAEAVRARVGWLFPGPDGKPIATLDKQVRRAFQAADLWEPKSKPGLHMLRRTFASRLLAAGVDVETVRELGGWADLDVVMRYLASTDDLKRRAVAALER